MMQALRGTVLVLLAFGCVTGCKKSDPAQMVTMDAGDSLDATTGETDAGTDAATLSSFPAVTSFSDTGPFATTTSSTAECTIFKPSPLGVGGLKHPVIIWGNGTTATPVIYRGLLTHLASHGFIVAAANTTNAGSGAQMLDCLGYVLDQNTTRGSAFYQHVDTTRIGASGHSQGGAGTIMAGSDSRVTVTAPIQPYILPIPGGGTFSMSSIAEQHGPMFLLSGSADTVAVPSMNQQPVYDGTNVSVVWATLEGATHFETVSNAGRFRGPLTAWFRAHLMDDTTAAELFPSTCTLCTTTGWTVVF